MIKTVDQLYTAKIDAALGALNRECIRLAALLEAKEAELEALKAEMAALKKANTDT